MASTFIDPENADLGVIFDLDFFNMREIDCNTCAAEYRARARDVDPTANCLAGPRKAI